MLGLFSDKSDHPLADLKSAREMFEQLDRTEPLEAIDEIDNWLESVSNDELLRPQRRLDLLFQLDNAGMKCARRMAWEYLNRSQAGHGQNLKLWQANRTYWRQLCTAYERILTRLAADSKAKDEVRSSLPVLHVRVLRGYMGCLKWDQFRYGPIDPELWKAAGRIYLLTDETRQAEKPVDIGDGSAASVTSWYLMLLVFHAASMDQLQPLEIELAEHLIAHFLPAFVLTSKVRPENVYWVDAAKPLPPTRLAKLPEITPTLRFMATANALTAIEALLSSITATEKVPPELRLGNNFSPVTVGIVLRHLALFCAPQPPMRSHARHHVKSWMRVAGGFGAACTALDGDDTASGSWVVDDVSRGGMRAQVTLSASDNLVIGALVAMKPDGGDNWLLGVVRRISRANQSLGSIGIETIGRTPAVLALDVSGIRETGLLLEAELVAGNAVLMVVAPGVWKDGGLIRATHNGAHVLLRPLEAARRGNDHVIGRYWVDTLSI